MSRWYFTSGAGRIQSGAFYKQLELKPGRPRGCPIKFKSMALSARTYIKEKSWTKLIRSLSEGVNEMPVKFLYENFLSLKAVCLRENTYDSEFYYTPRYQDGRVTIIISRREDDAESIG